MKRMMVLLFALAMGGGAQANLITHNGYTLDTDTNIVTGGGLEWLQWSEVKEFDLTLSYVLDPSNFLYQQGWRLASYKNMAGLFNDWGFGGSVWNIDENTRQRAYLSASGAEELSNRENFVDLFGATQELTSEDYDLYSTSAVFGNDGDGDELYNVALVSRTFQVYQGAQLFLGDALLYEDLIPATDTTLGRSFAFVRDSETVSVPEPSTLALLGLGLFALTLRNRHTN